MGRGKNRSKKTTLTKKPKNGVTKSEVVRKEKISKLLKESKDKNVIAQASKKEVKNLKETNNVKIDSQSPISKKDNKNNKTSENKKPIQTKNQKNANNKTTSKKKKDTKANKEHEITSEHKIIQPKSLFITGLPISMTQQEIGRHFGRNGNFVKRVSCQVQNYVNTGKAVIEFDNIESVKEILNNLDNYNQIFGHKKLVIKNHYTLADKYNLAISHAGSKQNNLAVKKLLRSQEKEKKNEKTKSKNITFKLASLSSSEEDDSEGDNDIFSDDESDSIDEIKMTGLKDEEKKKFSVLTKFEEDSDEVIIEDHEDDINLNESITTEDSDDDDDKDDDDSEDEEKTDLTFSNVNNIKKNSPAKNKVNDKKENNKIENNKKENNKKKIDINKSSDSDSDDSDTDEEVERIKRSMEMAFTKKSSSNNSEIKKKSKK